MFDWNDLRYLRALSVAGSFAGAARELGVKHTTVARRIAALESDLGVALVRKGGEQITLTDAGLDVLVHANEMKVVSDAIERSVARHQHTDAVEGLVRVTLPDTLAGYFVIQLAALRARHPHLTVNVLADQRVYDLLGGEADLAVRIADHAQPELVERKLGVVAWSLYASKSYVAARGHPRSSAEFASHDLLGYDGAALNASPGAAWFRDHLPDARFVMRGNNLLQLFNATILGTGVTLLPCFMAEREPTLLRLTAEAFHNRTIRLLFPADLKRVPRVRAVIDFLVEIFERDAALFGGLPVQSTDTP
ncbi:MAG: LysR family transcriptional regulator [Deltaproteobacteria bacterium]|nr:LysR family transcriptional regulator [Deltaproteobacteria bacterium]